MDSGGLHGLHFIIPTKKGHDTLTNKQDSASLIFHKNNTIFIFIYFYLYLAFNNEYIYIIYVLSNTKYYNKIK
jgi:hypothetical protein